MKFSIIKKITIFSLLILISGCENPKDVTVPKDISTWESDEHFIEAAKKLSDEDKKLLLAYSMRAMLSEAFGGEGLKDGTTIGQAIDIQKAWQAEQEQNGRDGYTTENQFPPKEFHPTPLSFQNDSTPNMEASPKYSIKINSKKCPENRGGGFATITFTNIGTSTIPSAHIFLNFKDSKGGLIHATSARTSPLSIPPGALGEAVFLKQGIGVPTCEIAAFQDGDGNPVEIN